MLTAEQALKQFADSNKPVIREIDSSVYNLPPVYVFSVFPGDLQIDLSFTKFFIHGCPEGEPYGPACKVAGMLHDYMQGQGDKLELIASPVPGVRAVQDAFQQHGLEAQGCFWTHNERPTPKEVSQAVAAMIPKLDALIAQGDAMYNRGDRPGAEHRAAARYRNQQRQWLTDSIEMQRCPYCGVSCPAGLAYCPNGDVLDEAKARKARPHQWVNVPATGKVA